MGPQAKPQVEKLGRHLVRIREDRPEELVEVFRVRIGDVVERVDVATDVASQAHFFRPLAERGSSPPSSDITLRAAGSLG
jgi:hypothetical protein